MRVDPSSITALRTGLEGLADAVERVTFQMSGAPRERGEAERDDLVGTVREYLLPRLRDPDAPVVTVVVGPTGAGKSLLVNSLAAEEVSSSGPLRPTTTAPLLWAHRAHGGRTWSEFVARVRERVGPALEVVVGEHEMTRDLTVIDCPPFDLTTAGGSAARRVLSLADLCVFVTSGLRYADAASWEFLDEIRGRGLPVVFVLNRLAADDRDALLADFASRLSDAGMLAEPDPSLVFAVPEVAGGRVRFLPADAVTTIRKELAELADPALRHGLVYQTAEGVSRSVAGRADDLCRLVEEERAAAERLADHVDRAYRGQVARLASSVKDGDLAWLVEHDHWPSVAVDLTGIVTRRAGVAAQESAGRWSRDPVGTRFLHEGGQGLWRHGHDTTYESQRLLEGWAEGLEDLAVERSRRRRLRRGVRRRSAEFMWKAVLDRTTEPPRAVRRTFRSGTADLVAAAEESLLATLERTLRGDAARFLAHVGSGGDLAFLEDVRLRADEVRAVLAGSAARSGLEGAEPAGAPEPPDDEDAPDPMVTTGFIPADVATPPGPGEDDDG
jgi:hypothetical protein